MFTLELIAGLEDILLCRHEDENISRPLLFSKPVNGLDGVVALAHALELQVGFHRSLQVVECTRLSR